MNGHAPAALPSTMTPYPLYGKLGGPQGRPGRMQKISPTLGFDPRTVHSVASCSIIKRQVYNLRITSLCKFLLSLFKNTFLKTLLSKARHNARGWCHSCALCAKMWTDWVTCKFMSPSEKEGALKRSKH